jgi:hypothetical protein
MKKVRIKSEKSQEEILNCIRNNISFEMKTGKERIFYIAGQENKQGILGKFVGKKTFVYNGFLGKGEWKELGAG